MISRRDFISRFFKGVAVAAIAPEVIAKACEDHAIARGTGFSFGRGAMDLGYGQYRGLAYRPVDVLSFSFAEDEVRWASQFDYKISDIETALKADNWDVIQQKHESRRFFNARKKAEDELTAALNRATGKMPDRIMIPLNSDDTLTIGGKRYPIADFKAECVHRIEIPA